MRVLIAGCGYIGTALGESFVREGVEVWGLRRNATALHGLADQGINPIEADLLDLSSLKNLPEVDVLVLCQAQSHQTDSYLKTYLEATQNILQACQNKPLKKIILISSTSVYSTSDGSWVDEMTDPRSSAYRSLEAENNARVLLEAETAVLSSEFPAIVFRLAGIYGPGRHRLAALRSGKMKPSFSGDFTNRIHRDDIVRGIQLLVEKGVSGQIYIGADDHPSTQNEFYAWLYEKLNLEPPKEGEIAQAPVHTVNRRCSNQKIKKLGLVLKYPTFREGYQELLREGVLSC